MASAHGEHVVPGLVQDALTRIGGLIDTLFEAGSDAIFLMDGMRIVDCNPATLEMFGGRSKADIVGQTPVAFSPERQPDGAASAEKASRLVRAAIDGAPQRFEWRQCKLDGTPIDVELRLTRFVAGGSRFLVAVARDITARKRAEATLRRQYQAGELINGILARCAVCAPGDLDANVVSSLKDLAAFVGVDHAYFFARSADRSTYSCTHESCGPGVAPLAPRFQDVPFGSDAAIETALSAGEVVRIDSVRDHRNERVAGAALRADPGCRSVLDVPTFDPSGELVGAIGVDSHVRLVKWSDSNVMLCRIIGNALAAFTERKRAADATLHEKRFSECLIDSLPGIFFLYDAELRLRRWNKSHEALGYTAEEMRGMHLSDWFATEEGRRDATERAKDVLERDGAWELPEAELRTKDGAVVHYLCSGVRVTSPTGAMLLGVGVDISARVRAERALSASERNYRVLFDAPIDALFIHDASGRVLEVNERACAMYGFDASQAGRFSVDDLSLGEPPYSQREAVEHVRRAVHEGPQVFEWRSRRLDGTTFWSEVALRAFRVDGETRVIASVRDVSERKLAALEHERLVAAEAASTAKSEFLAMLSHELRTPLSAIQMSLDVLRGPEMPDEERRQRVLDVIERNVKLQTRLVSDLLDLSRIERSKLTIQPAAVRLDDIVLAAVQTCRGDAARADVTLEAHTAAGLEVDGDAVRLQQVVINLVGNAIKFTPAGGRVTVTMMAKDRRGCVVVEDTGVGIATERLPEVFEMFQQGQVAALRTPGLGIGLALVKAIVELHGGRVWAESAGPGSGSRFTVELPLRAHAT